MGQQMGVPSANSVTYASNTMGVNAVFESTSANLMGLRSGAKSSMAYSDEDRDLQRKAGVK